MIKQLWPFILGSVALGLDAYVIAGLLPAMSSDLGTTEALTGLGVTVFTAAYAISGPLFAGKAGLNPQRNLTLALLCFTVGNLITMVAPGIVIFIISRIFAGSAAGIYSPLASSVAAALVPQKDRGKALSLVLGGLVTGTVFGVPAGLLIAESTSWRLTIGLITIVGVIALLGVALKKGAALPAIPSPNLKERLRTLSRSTNLLTILVTLFTGIASLGLYTFIIPMLSDSRLVADTTLAIWVWGIGGALGVFAIGKIIDALNKSLAVTAVISLALAVVFLVIGMNPSMAVLLLLLFLWGALGWSSLAPQQDTLLSTNPHDGTTAVAANASANYLGSSLGSGLGALIISAGVTGTHLAFYAAIPAFLAFGIQLLRIRMARPVH